MAPYLTKGALISGGGAAFTSFWSQFEQQTWGEVDPVTDSLNSILPTLFYSFLTAADFAHAGAGAPPYDVRGGLNKQWGRLRAWGAQTWRNWQAEGVRQAQNAQIRRAEMEIRARLRPHLRRGAIDWGANAGPNQGNGPTTIRPVNEWSNQELQNAIDQIHRAQYRGGPIGRSVPMTLTITRDGRVILSQVGQKPGANAIAEAERIFGQGRVQVVQGRGVNAPGFSGHHAEARGIQAAGEGAEGAIQVSSHYACVDCEIRQNITGVNNPTGVASTPERGGRIIRPDGPHD